MYQELPNESRVGPKSHKLAGGWHAAMLSVGLTGVPVLVVLATVPESRGTERVALVAGVVAGVLLLSAALSFYFHWLMAPSRRHGWTASAMVVLAVQVLVSSGAELAGSTAHGGLSWHSAADLLGTALVLVLMLLGCRSVPNPQPLLIGLGLGVVVTVVQTSGPTEAGITSESAASVGVLVTMMAGHLVIAWSVTRDRSLVAWARNRLATTVVLVGIAHAAKSLAFESTAADLVAAAAQVTAAALWASVSFVLLRDELTVQHRRSIGLEDSLLELEETLRGSREQLHEVRSTVAGVASAARLLDDPTLGDPVRTKLQRSIRTELDRLERLVGQRPAADPGPVDLDATLDVLLEAHRAQGRTVVWEPTGGEQVHARPDDVAEALNILLDNAATHAGTASRVAVKRDDDLVEIAVSDAGPGVSPEARETIFDWGVHSNDSPGQGIGLHVARRLVTEHGGSLTLADSGADPGSSFIIKLPAARRSEDDDDSDAGRSA